LPKPEPIQISGTRCYVPGFGDGLRTKEAEQDIHVNEDTHQWSRPS
jgi:hypothetical protein